MKYFAILILCAMANHGFAEDPKFPVYLIPDSLLKDANAVVRQNRMIFTITSQRSAVLYSYQVVTVLNAKGNDLAETVLYYDKLTKIKNVRAGVYDAQGNQIKRLKNNEIYDQSVYSSGTLFSDDRLKRIDLAQGSYPYTVEIEYEKEYNFLFHIDGIDIIPDENVSVQYASYTLTYPPAFKPRHKAYKTDVSPKTWTDGLNESTSWVFENLRPVKSEPFDGHTTMGPSIRAAPSKFEYEDYAGDMSSWEGFGKWILTLNNGRNQLPENTIQKIKEVTSKASTTEEKVKLVYEYLQGKTRYVSVQLGIGGYQPFQASSVDQNGYGDCKALSNYMVSMLEAIGIKANYVLVYAGRNARPMDVNFSCSQFNHAIVAVPNKADTIWLECTSQIDPFGFQGTFTGDRKALMITEKGGEIVNTTRYLTEDNIQSRTAEVKLDVNGNATAKVKTIYKGIQYENGHLNMIVTGKADDQKEWIQDNTKIPSFDLLSYSMKNNKARIPSAVVSADYVLNKYATISGKRVFLIPNLMNRNSYVPEKIVERKSDVYIMRGYIDYDTVKFEIPEAIYPEAVPPPITIKSKFGEYEAKFALENGVLVYTRKVRLDKGRFPAATYNELVDFYKGISKADNMKVVFLNKT